MLAATVASLGVTMPPVSPTGLQNRIWRWRGFDVRYQCLGDERADGPAVLFVHGLFVNADHWRRNLPALADAGCRCYAIDLLGYGYSSKPNPLSEAAKAVSGENGRSLSAPVADLGTAGGGTREGVEVELAHPVAGSPYNFYTWSEHLGLVVIKHLTTHTPSTLRRRSSAATSPSPSSQTRSGRSARCRPPSTRPHGSTVSAAVGPGAPHSVPLSTRRPLISLPGVAIVNPNFRELHVSEQPALLRPLLVPVIGAVQRALRERGQPLFDALAKPATVQQILKEPYFDADMVTDELVDVPPTAPLLPADRGAHPPAIRLGLLFSAGAAHAAPPAGQRRRRLRHALLLGGSSPQAAAVAPSVSCRSAFA